MINNIIFKYINKNNKSKYIKHTHLCFIFSKNNIYSFADNLNGIHSEINAINKFIKKYSDRLKNKSFNILIIRLINNNILKLSKPCKYCYNKIKCCDIRIKNIYYSDNNNNIIKIKTNKFKTDHISYAFKNNFN